MKCKFDEAPRFYVYKHHFVSSKRCLSSTISTIVVLFSSYLTMISLRGMCVADTTNQTKSAGIQLTSVQ